MASLFSSSYLQSQGACYNTNSRRILRDGERKSASLVSNCLLRTRCVAFCSFICSCYCDCAILSEALKRIYCANQTRTVESSTSLGPLHEAHNPSMSADFPIKAEENTPICVLMPCVCINH